MNFVRSLVNAVRVGGQLLESGAAHIFKTPTSDSCKPTESVIWAEGRVEGDNVPLIESFTIVNS